MNLTLALACSTSMLLASEPVAAPVVHRAVTAAAPAVDAGAREEPVPDPTLKTIQGRALQPEKVTARVREALKRKMKSHSRDFLSLPLHIVLADFGAVERATQGIMNEPRIDKAAAGDDLSGLSGPFFQLQDQLRERAGALNQAARGKDVSAMTTALGPLMETCATCHLIYREPLHSKDGAKK
ncbi:MAG: cytochrome c [Myxococcaceae bacterium]|nr:cytochrome c [Myxococcaceae bacterium]